MKKRETSFRDYGFADGEARRLIELCRSNDFAKQSLLQQCAVYANPFIANEIYLSIVNKRDTYDRQSKRRYIPISRADFYGYRRLCLAMLRNFLVLYGEWG